MEPWGENIFLRLFILYEKIFLYNEKENNIRNSWTN